MSEYLFTKTAEYERLLAGAIDAATPADGEAAGATACLEMAEAYLDDGRHFLERNDLSNALAAFAYGHGWLDAGVRLGVLTAEDSEFFTI